MCTMSMGVIRWRTLKCHRTRNLGLALSKESKKKPFFHLDQTQANQRVLYKDDDIIVVNKPAGLAVHAGPKLRNDLSHYMHYWQYGLSEPPQLAHRLDKATSGVLILTRHKAAAKWVAQLFHEHKIIKKYWAITVSVPLDWNGSIKSPLAMRNVAQSGGRHSMNRVVMSNSEGTKAHPHKMAWTEYQVLSVPTASPRRCCLMELHAVTGFKHQLRVHLADGLKCPVFGDHQFGGPLFRQDQALRRKVQGLQLDKGHLFLHALHVEIPGYRGENRPPLVVKAPLPDYFDQAIRQLKLTVEL